MAQVKSCVPGSVLSSVGTYIRCSSIGSVIRGDAETAALRFDILLHIIVAHVQETPLVFFQNKAGQAAGCIRGSVNSDSIGTNLWGDRRRVTVHDKFSVLRLTEQERVSDIQKIIAILAIEGHARPYSGMTEKVIADGR